MITFLFFEYVFRMIGLAGVLCAALGLAWLALVVVERGYYR